MLRFFEINNRLLTKCACVVIFCVAVSHSRLAFATSDPLPPVNDRSIIGVWEAISETDLRVFRMQFFSNGRALLAIALPNLEPIRFRLDSKTITEGRYNFVFRQEQGKYEIRMQGAGVADEGFGQLSGQLVMKLDPPPDSTWSLKFIKMREQPYIEQIYGLSQAAKRAISKAPTTR